jgi:hypothetical protein
MIPRLVLLSLATLYSALAFLPRPASAQGLLPPHPLRLELGGAKQNGSNFFYYLASLDVYKNKKRPKLSIYSAPTFSFYFEGADSISGYSTAAVFPPPSSTLNALETFRGKGLSATWGLPLSFQVGVGAGRYTSTARTGAVGVSGLGGKIFARWGLKNGTFTEFATIFPATRRFTSTQISVGKRF